MDSLSILLVDDDRWVRQATAWILADAGHAVTEAKDGLEALAHLEQRAHFDLIVTDISMPLMNGLALIKAVNRLWPNLPVLLVSGRAQPPDSHPFIMKPFSADTLLRAVAKIVETQVSACYPGL